MLSKGLKIGRIFGIDIELDIGWFFIFGLFAWMFSSFYEGDSLFYKILVGIFVAILFFASVLFHELAHAFVAKLHGISVSSIRLWILGGVAQLSKNTETAGQEFRIAIAGPLASILIGIFFGIVSVWASSNLDFQKSVDDPSSLGLFGYIFFYLAFLNVILAVFNMIPAYPLDGGRVLRSILWKWWQDAKKAARTASIIGKFFGWLMIAFGALSFILAGNMGGLWFAFMGWFLKSAAEQSWTVHLLEMTKVRDVNYLLRDESWFLDPENNPLKEISCSTEDTLLKCVDTMTKARTYFLEVIEDGKPVGILFAEDIFKFARKNRI